MGALRGGAGAVRAGRLPLGPALRPPRPRHAERAFDAILGAFVRGRVHAYRGDEDSAVAELRAAGFGSARLHRGDRHPAAAEAREDPGAAVICVLEAAA